jgi:hypothetical protein
MTAREAMAHPWLASVRKAAAEAAVAEAGAVLVPESPLDGGEEP